jgi:hypothetical protein
MKDFGHQLNLARLALVLLFVFSSSTANAECAWILWIKEEIDFIYPNTPPSFSTQWKIQDALPTQEKCDELRKLAWDIKVKQIDRDKLPGIEEIITVPNKSIFSRFRRSPEVVGGRDDAYIVLSAGQC